MGVCTNRGVREIRWSVTNELGNATDNGGLWGMAWDFFGKSDFFGYGMGRPWAGCGNFFCTMGVSIGRPRRTAKCGTSR